ncbi:MAG: beta-galactosidase trimerization domain-containing protein [Candidatus Pacebacteria bacterium]|nr:beta-galactosidase trimerization domain-containing protein [Candidatus Paceibacterota bacterium]
MAQYELRFRQVHLDFHTSPHIPNIGNRFRKDQWQEALRLGHVNSVTCFAKCHHGLSYHPTRVGTMHPHLTFDLLRAQFEASKEIDVNVPIYLSAGLDDVAAEAHPEWREMSVDGKYQGWAGSFVQPGFRMMCFMSPYLDFLCDQIREVVELFPDCNGIFLDIIHQGECCCKWCREYMETHGLSLDKQADRQTCANAALERYYRETTAAVRSKCPDMPVFHNSGHIPKGKHEILEYFSHLELESLPTGGWGYDHFPLSANYCRNLDADFLGMTGKFQTTWGEFGGYKHPNALRYECAAMLAFGAKCSIGDQLHPNGEMDPSTYRIMGEAYSEVERKEPWCREAANIADIGVLSSESEHHGSSRDNSADKGVGRILLEEHLLFDLIDRSMDLERYKLLILPDDIMVDDELQDRIQSFLDAGGKLMLTGRSGLTPDRKTFAFNIGAEYRGESEHQPDYLDAGLELAASFLDSPLVMYARSQKVRVTDGDTLAGIEVPYFNRTWRHYCSHQHAPNAEPSEFAAAVRKGNILYLAHPIFTIYAGFGAVAYRQYAANAIRLMLGDEASLMSNMPSTARVSLTHQEAEKRYVLHLLYANTIRRGDQIHFSDEGYVRDSAPLEVIEELLPLHDVTVQLNLLTTPTKATLEPQGTEIPLKTENGTVMLNLDSFTCHQMIALQYT